MKVRPHSTADLRQINRNRVYRCLYGCRKPKSRQELARELSMSLPTLNQYLEELLAEGLVDDSEVMDSTGGRKPRGLLPVPGARFAVGMELTSRHIRAAAVDLQTRELGEKVIEREFRADREYGACVARTVEELLEENGLERGRLLGAGLTVPGIVDGERAVITRAPTLRIQEIGTEFLTGGLSCPARLFNDANAGGFAEWWGRADRKALAYLSVSRGVGGALLVDGVPYPSLHGRSGEFGHMCVHPGGTECACGRRGCLESYCSASRLSDRLGVTLEEFFLGLDRGDGAYAELWETYLDDLATGIANIHAMLDCEVVLGGKLSPFLAGRLEGLDRRLSALDPDYREEGYLSVGRCHEKASSIGAALYFIDQFIRQI